MPAVLVTHRYAVLPAVATVTHTRGYILPRTFHRTARLTYLHTAQLHIRFWFADTPIRTYAHARAVTAIPRTCHLHPACHHVTPLVLIPPAWLLHCPFIHPLFTTIYFTWFLYRSRLLRTRSAVRGYGCGSAHTYSFAALPDSSRFIYAHNIPHHAWLVATHARCARTRARAPTLPPVICAPHATHGCRMRFTTPPRTVSRCPFIHTAYFLPLRLDSSTCRFFGSAAVRFCLYGYRVALRLLLCTFVMPFTAPATPLPSLGLVGYHYAFVTLVYAAWLPYWFFGCDYYWLLPHACSLPFARAPRVCVAGCLVTHTVWCLLVAFTVPVGSLQFCLPFPGCWVGYIHAFTRLRFALPHLRSRFIRSRFPRVTDSHAFGSTLRLPTHGVYRTRLPYVLPLLILVTTTFAHVGLHISYSTRYHTLVYRFTFVLVRSVTTVTTGCGYPHTTLVVHTTGSLQFTLLPRVSLRGYGFAILRLVVLVCGYALRSGWFAYTRSRLRLHTRLNTFGLPHHVWFVLRARFIAVCARFPLHVCVRAAPVM